MQIHTSETKSVVHAAATAVSHLCQVSIAFDEVCSTGTLKFDYRIEMVPDEKTRDGMIEEATIKTNVNNFHNRKLLTNGS
jgi:hypothetical protein